MNAQFYRKEERDFKQTSQPDRQARREMTLTKRIEEIEARLEQSNQDAFNSDDKWLAFIDHAPTDLAFLLSLVKELRAALDGIANIQNLDWPDRIYAAQAIARQALKRCEEVG